MRTNIVLDDKLIERAQKLIVSICHRIGAGNTVACQMRHQIKIERQFVGAEYFEQREHKAAIAGRDKIVGIFDTGRDTLQTL